MSEKKDLSVEELISIAQNPIQSTNKNSTVVTEAHRFAIDKNLKDGQTKVNAKLIFDIYLQWKGNDKPLEKRQFFIQLSKLFQRTRDAYSTYYLLDASAFEFLTTGENIKETSNNVKEAKEEQKTDSKE